MLIIGNREPLKVWSTFRGFVQNGTYYVSDAIISYAKSICNLQAIYHHSKPRSFPAFPYSRQNGLRLPVKHYVFPYHLNFHLL